MSIPRINHAITHHPLLDMLTQDDCAIGDLYRGLAARTGAAPSIPEFLELLQWMESAGLIEECAATEVSRDVLMDRYKSWLGTATLPELQLDPVGIIYALTPAGRSAWQAWRSTFDR